MGVLSNCPLRCDTKILYWSEYYNQFKLSTIKDIYCNYKRDKKEFIEVLNNGKRIKCKINKFNKNANYRIELMNGAVIDTTADHLNKVYGKDYVRTENLSKNDYLPFSLSPYEETENLTYEEGKLVGMFLGSGNYRNRTEITFSLNIDTDQDDIEFLKTYCPRHFDAKFNEFKCISQISGKDRCINISVNSSSLRGLIEQFVIGDSALKRSINLRALSCSKEFRKGIIDGLYTTDGGNSNRIYTSSEALKDSLVVLCASLGIATTVGTDNRDGRLGKNTPYCIGYYTPKEGTQLKNVYIIEDGYMWFKIKDIKKIKDTNVAYCLEVVDDNAPAEFMLGNGIITHNCRLLSDTSRLDAFINSIGGTALSIGSCRVSTINLVRIAYETNLNETEYLNLLRERVLLDCKALYSMRHILKRNIEKGLLPNYTDGALELDKQYINISILSVIRDSRNFWH